MNALPLLLAHFPTDYPPNDPRHHTAKVRHTLDELEHHLRAELLEVQDPRAHMLFETSADVLHGLQHAFEQYEAGVEPAWQETAAVVTDALKSTASGEKPKR